MWSTVGFYKCFGRTHLLYDAVICYVQDMKLISDTLSTKAFVEVLSYDDPKVTDEYGGVNLELEVC